MKYLWSFGLLCAVALSGGKFVMGSDDTDTLEPVVAKLSQTVNQLQAELTALQRTVEKSKPAVIFSVRHSGFAFNVSSGQTILFNHILINKGGGYSAVDGEFTAPVSGLYHVSYRAWSNAGSPGFVALMLNAQRISEIPVGDTDYHSGSSHSLPLQLQQGDILSVHISSPAGYGRNYITMMGEHRSTFMGYLLEED